MPAFRPSPILATQRMSQLAPLKWFKSPSRTQEKAVFVTKRLLDGDRARDTYYKMRGCGIRPCVPIVVLAIKACREKWHLLGLHNDLVVTKNDRDVSVANTLIDCYAGFGLVADARKVFEGIPHRDAVSWNTVIKGYVSNRDGEAALDLFSRMEEDGLRPNARTYLAAIQACSMIASREKWSMTMPEEEVRASKGSGLGRRSRGDGIGRALLEAKANAGRTLIGGRAGELVSVGSGGRFLTKFAALERGRKIHEEIVDNQHYGDVFLASSLVDMYSKCGSLADAKLVFDSMDFHDVVSWTSIILAHCNCGEADMALNLFTRMKEEGFIPDGTTFLAVVKSISSLAAKEIAGTSGDVPVARTSLEKGRSLHAELKKLGIRSEVGLESSLVDMYIKCGSLEEAKAVFEKMPQRDSLAWTSMISGAAQVAGDGELSLQMFARMQEEGVKPDASTFAAALFACGSIAVKQGKREQGKFKKELALQKGIAIHAKLAKMVKFPKTSVENALVDMYAKCGSIPRAREVFDAMAERNTVSWNSIILGLAQNDEHEATLRYFSLMQHEGFAPGSKTMVAVFNACAGMVALETGRRFHTEARSAGLDKAPAVASSIVDFYAKCGSIDDAKEVFDSLETRDLVTWNALIAGYSCCGDAARVLELLSSAEREVGFVNGVTLLCVLASYSHAGMVEQGKDFFETMASRYGVEAGVEHYTIMVDLLGRANHLEEAAEMAKRISRDSNTFAWMSVLGACYKWKNVEVGKIAFDSIASKESSSAYALMANIYAAAGMWKERQQVWDEMRSKCLTQAQGWSCWVDSAGAVHKFPRDEHPQMEKIVAKLTLWRGGEARDEDQGCEHSERFAAGCAVVNSPAGADIRISKSGRVCGDCHKVLAEVSRHEGGRLVVCKDTSRLHVFEHGRCSCGDGYE